MRNNLDSLRAEIQQYLQERGLAVFHATARQGENQAGVFWDTLSHDNYREFIQVAEASGARLLTLASREFSVELLDAALDQLAGTSLDRDQRRAIEIRLRELRGFDGFVCQLELGFDYGQRDYLFEVRTEWFEELRELLERIDEAYEEEADEGPMGGYFSRN